MISTDLFQTIALALMFIILIVLLAVLATLNSLKKSLGSGAAPADTGATGYGDTTSYPSYGGATEPAYGYGSQTASQPAVAEPRQEVATSYVPVAQATQPAAQAAPSSTAAPMLTGNEPEEQPFERDGRWWFKRGGDLLVYDEGTGQWVAAGTAGAIATPAATTPTAGGYTAPAGVVGEGWRCSSCGAINGSTATVCRMCFTPR